MSTAQTLTIFDILSGNVPKDRMEDALLVLTDFVKKATKEQVADKQEDRVELQVERTVLREMREVATKEDIRRLDGRVQALFYWILGGFLSVLLAYLFK